MNDLSNLRPLIRRLPAMLLLGLLASAAAQEGFPLDGTWRAELDGNRTVVLVMKWDGEHVNGMINPGPRSIRFSEPALEPSDWGVHIEATKPDGSSIVIAGTLVDIGSYNRRIVGTWTEDGATTDLDLRRE